MDGASLGRVCMRRTIVPHGSRLHKTRLPRARQSQRWWKSGCPQSILPFPRSWTVPPRHIEPGETADSANNEVGENNDVPCPAQSEGKPQNCGRDTERHNVRQ